MLTLEERRESFVEDALPYIAGTDYGDGKRVIARTGLAMGFDQGHIFAIDKAYEWLKKNIDNYYHSSCQSDDCYFDSEQMLEDFSKAMKE